MRIYNLPISQLLFLCTFLVNQLSAQTLLEEVKQRDTEGNPIEVFYRDENLNVVMYKLLDSDGIVLLEVPYQNGKINGKVKRVQQFTFEEYSTNYENGLVSDSGVTFYTVNDVGSKYIVGEWLVEKVINGKFHGSCSFSWFEVEDKKFFEQDLRENYSYLPNEFMYDIVKLSHERSYFNQFIEYQFENGKLSDNVEFENGRIEFSNDGSVKGILRRNQTGFVTDSIFLGNKFSMLNGKYVKTNDVEVGVKWSLMNPSSFLDLDYSRGDFNFAVLKDSVHQGFFDMIADSWLGQKWQGKVSVKGYRLKPWFGIRIFYPGLSGVIIGIPYESPSIRGNMEKESLNEYFPFLVGENSKYFDDVGLNTETINYLHIGSEEGGFYEGGVSKVKIGSKNVSNCLPCRTLSTVQMISGLGPCKLACEYQLTLPTTHEQIFKEYNKVLQINGYVITEIGFNGCRSFLQEHIR